MSATGTSSNASEPFRLQTDGRALAAVLAGAMALVVGLSLKHSAFMSATLPVQVAVGGGVLLSWLWTARRLQDRCRVHLTVGPHWTLDEMPCEPVRIEWRGPLLMLELSRSERPEFRIAWLHGEPQREFKLAVIAWQATHWREKMAP